MLYELLTNCIPADVIIKVLVRELLPKLDDQLKHEVVYWAAYYEHRVQIGSKEIFHLEAFIAKFMSLVSVYGQDSRNEKEVYEYVSFFFCYTERERNPDRLLYFNSA